jgi:hypothetical protein
VTGAEDGLLAAYKDAAELPKIMYTNTSYEYWARAASMLHTTPDAVEDVAPLDNERLYVHSGAQHYVGAWPPPARDRIPGSAAWPGNPLEFRPTLRALMAHLVEWVAEDREPPASAYPVLRDHTLVAPEALDFPAIPGVTRPKVVYAPNRADYGPRWSSGIVDKEPPELGAAFPVRVPQVDAVGNDQGGVRGVGLRVPLATYTGWSLRTGLANPGELADFKGLFIPLPRTLPDATESGDSRPAIMTLYASREEYLAQADAAAHALLDQGYLLEEDLPAVNERAAALWDWIFQNNSAAAR